MPMLVLGAGAWGTALAVRLAANGHPVQMWARDPDHAQAMARDRENHRHLPGIVLPSRLTLVTDLATALPQERDVLIAVPSQAFRELVQAIAAYLPAETRLAWATKGLEPDTGKFLHEVLAETTGDRPAAVVSGPTFAREVAQGLPTALTVASTDTAFAADLVGQLHGTALRAYTSTDVIGVELGGAVKNVLAIAAGIADGLGFGANARAALVTRGLAEMMRLGIAMGGQQETLMGLAGLGDLVLTCTDDQSRNRRLGLALGRGQALTEALAAIGVAEGVPTARRLVEQAASCGVEMPITEQVDQVLYHGRPPPAAVQALLTREPKAES